MRVRRLRRWLSRTAILVVAAVALWLANLVLGNWAINPGRLQTSLTRETPIGISRSEALPIIASRYGDVRQYDSAKGHFLEAEVASHYAFPLPIGYIAYAKWHFVEDRLVAISVYQASDAL